MLNSISWEPEFTKHFIIQSLHLRDGNDHNLITRAKETIIITMCPTTVSCCLLFLLIFAVLAALGLRIDRKRAREGMESVHV